MKFPFKRLRINRGTFFVARIAPTASYAANDRKSPLFGGDIASDEREQCKRYCKSHGFPRETS